jgi:hypothetical protein
VSLRRGKGVFIKLDDLLLQLLVHVLVLQEAAGTVKKAL